VELGRRVSLAERIRIGNSSHGVTERYFPGFSCSRLGIAIDVVTMCNDDALEVPVQHLAQALFDHPFVAPAKLVFGRRFRAIPLMENHLPPILQLPVHIWRLIGDILDQIDDQQSSALAVEERNFPNVFCAPN
jgi:hypothetical protein